MVGVRAGGLEDAPVSSLGDWLDSEAPPHPHPCLSQLERDQGREEVLLRPEDIWASLFVLQQTVLERLLLAWH